MTNKLIAQSITYQLDGHEPEQVLIRNRAYVAWDQTRGKRQWPPFSEGPFLFYTFITWYQVCVIDKRHDLKFEEWSDQVVAIAPDDEDEAEDVDPTPSPVEPD